MEIQHDKPMRRADREVPAAKVVKAKAVAVRAVGVKVARAVDLLRPEWPV